MIDATPALRAYAAWRGAGLDAEDFCRSQARVLARLVRTARATPFGQTHGFADIRSVGAFQQQVPLRDYEAMWEGWWRRDFPGSGATWPGRTLRFALSSGTSSGRTKYIPVTRAMMAANARAALDVLTHHVRARPWSRILSGQSFVLGGSTDLRRLAPGVYAGDLSGIAAGSAPVWARPFAFPPRAVALMDDWDAKLAAIGRALPGRRITSLSGTPSWLLLMLERAGSRAATETFPALEMLVHGGVSFTPYRARFAQWLRGSGAETREVYPASEGFFAAADRGPDDGLRLITDGGVFFEFVPVAERNATRPTRAWLRDVVPGVDYALVVSTCAGLWAYLPGDVVRFVSVSPPRVVVVGRTTETLSEFGEHVTGAEFFAALGGGEATVGSETVGSQGRHVVIAEGFWPDPDGIDRRLMAANADYEAHRRGGQMLPPRIVTVTPGTFAAWMRAEGKLGGQNKLPRVLDAARLARLLDLVATHPDISGAVEEKR